MRISDWSSDVCSSDLLEHHDARALAHHEAVATLVIGTRGTLGHVVVARGQCAAGSKSGDADAADGRLSAAGEDRKGGVEGTGVSVRVGLGGRRFIKKKRNKMRQRNTKKKRLRE